MDRSLTLNRFTRNFNSLVSKKSRLLVAVSGGMDSIALLHLSSKFKKDYEIFGVHVNHGLREASESEEKFVRGLCHDYNILLSVHNANRYFIPGESMEMWARRIRQDAFESARKEYNCDFVLTAHHANDNAETILMHLDDGCGVEGLRGALVLPPDWSPGAGVAGGSASLFSVIGLGVGRLFCSGRSRAWLRSSVRCKSGRMPPSGPPAEVVAIVMPLPK